MGISTFFNKFIKKQESSEMPRRKRIRRILKNLCITNDFRLRCRVQFLPPYYLQNYSIEEVIEKIDRSQWDGDSVFSSEMLNPFHRKSKLAFFPTEGIEMIRVERSQKNVYHMGKFLFRSEGRKTKD